MATVPVYNMEGAEVGTIELSDAVFGIEIKEHLVHQAVVQYLANRRQGTQKAKTRGEVRGGGRKPWRQKGTGHARQGSIRAPQWKGGGVVFAPVPRDYSFKMNRKEKNIALKSALTNKAVGSNIIVLDDLKMNEIKTKAFVGILKALKIEKRSLVVTDMNVEERGAGKVLVTNHDYDNLVLSARNVPDVKTMGINNLNVYDVMNAHTLVLTKSAVAQIEEVYA